MLEAAFRTEVTQVAEMPEAGTIHLEGRVTYEEAPDVRVALLDEVGKQTGTKVVLELAGIEDIDTAGAAVLAEALKFGLTRGMRVLLCSPSESVMRIFRLAGFEDVLGHCCADPQETWRRLQE
ncbi:MAG: STAS domain-containing protein [Planctomycetota bacterium]